MRESVWGGIARRERGRMIVMEKEMRGEGHRAIGGKKGREEEGKEGGTGPLP